MRGAQARLQAQQIPKAVSIPDQQRTRQEKQSPKGKTRRGCKPDSINEENDGDEKDQSQQHTGERRGRLRHAHDFWRRHPVPSREAVPCPEPTFHCRDTKPNSLTRPESRSAERSPSTSRAGQRQSSNAWNATPTPQCGSSSGCHERDVYAGGGFEAEIGSLAASTINSFDRLAAQCRDAGCSGGR